MFSKLVAKVSSREESCSDNDLVDSDISIGETSKKEVSRFVPC